MTRALLAASAAALVSIATACPTPPVDGPPDAGNVFLADAGPFIPPPPPPTDADGGIEEIIDAGPVNETVVVTGVTPPSGPQAGGNRVRIDGFGFTGACNSFASEGEAGDGFCRVTFGDVEASNIIPIQLPESISVEVPPCTEPGPVTVRVQTELGIGELVGGYTCFSPVTIASVEPSSGSTEGGELVTIAGEGFSNAMIVELGGRQVVGLIVDEAADTATFLTPPCDVGRHDVTATDAFGRSSLELAFTCKSPLRIDSVEPAIVDDNGAVIDVFGSGFRVDDDGAIAASIGGTGATVDNIISEARMRVRVPLGLSGPQDVAVSYGGATDVLEDALVVLPATTGAFTLTGAIPARLDAAGGSAVTLVGEGLTSVTAVTVGGAAATDLAVVDDRHITFTAPAGTVGPAVVQATRSDATTAQLTLVYVAVVEVAGVNPASGEVAGGTAVTISGRGFVDPVSVTFGGIPATDIVVVSDTSITATTPAGAAGFVDVVVESNGERAVRADGFRFVAPLQVVGIRPARGAFGGLTFATVSGSGFTNGTPNVTFELGIAPALEVNVVNDSTLTLRTPPSVQIGLSDIAVNVGAETATAESAFTYFNPANIVGGPSGGPIEGAIYVTAIDAGTGQFLPGFLAYVGTSDTPIAAGITNAFGTATISGPEVFGPQTVTVTGDCFSKATFVDVNATNLSVYLFPTCGAPPQPGEGPPPPPVPTITGRVFGFAKEFFDPAALDQSGCSTGPPAKCEIAFAEVRTTNESEFAGNPFPPGGANVVFEEGGTYTLISRPGRLAVIALAGIFDLNNDKFRLRQLGVRREVFPQFGVNLIDQDIELTIDLDAEIDLSLPDAPMRFEESQIGFLPTITRVIPFLQFGGEGTFVYTQAVEGKRNHALEEMPDIPGEMLTFVSGAYTTDGANLFTEAGTANLVAGETRVTGNNNFFEWTATDQFGNLLVPGQIFVTNRPDGTRFASVIEGIIADEGVLQLQEAPDFSAANAAYHIGSPGPPSSEVIQDGVGDLRSGVTIQPVLGLPEVLSPTENAAMVDRTLRWKAAPGQQPSVHDMFICNVILDGFQFTCGDTIWEFFVDGARTKVLVPEIPTVETMVPALPQVAAACVQDNEILPDGGCGFLFGLTENYVPPTQMAVGPFFWQHEAIFVPGLDSNAWSLLQIGLQGRRAWTTDVHFFIHGRD